MSASHIKLEEAFAFYERGQLAQAKAACEALLLTDPNHVDVLHLLGIIEYQSNNPQRAVEYFNRVIAIKPDYINAYFNRANVLVALKDFEQVVATYDSIIKIKPDFAHAYVNRGLALHELKQLNAAIENYDQAIKLKPDFPEAHFNRGNTLMELKQFDEALKSYDRAIEIKPDYAKAYFNRGSVFWKLKKLEGAFESFTRCVSIKNDYVEAYVNGGLVLAELNRFQEAVRYYNRAIALNPDFAESYACRGVALQELKRLEEAIQSFEKCIALKPDFDYLPGTLLHCKMKLCDWSQLNEHLTDMVKRIEKGERCSPLFPLLSLTDSLAVQQQAAGIFAHDRFLPNHELGDIPKHLRTEKIRVGYFSADFHFHPVSILLVRLFELHDKNRFELIAFSLATHAHDAMRERLTHAFDQFIDVHPLPDKAVAQLARDMKIDIAVDLGGATQHTRTGIFCYRAAPIQVNYLGYPGTMGTDIFDYILADPIIIPQESRPYYAEKIAYLPQYQPNDDTRLISDTPFTRKELGLPDTGFVFCSLNHSYKINPTVFDGWMRILKSVAGSCLFLYADNSAVEKNLRKEAKNRGVEADRLVFAKRLTERSDYLARFKVMDLFLDTFPYNAHATASDVLWAGLPLLTLAGKTFASRVAASLLTALGLPELITHTQKDYEALAIELANNPARLNAIKMTLAANRLTTPLFDAACYAKQIEAAYTRMIERYDAGLAPDHLLAEERIREL